MLKTITGARPAGSKRWAGLSGTSGNRSLPDRITLFQQEIEDECGDDEDEIVVAIGETLIHELGHYFGLSEDEIMEIEEHYWRGTGADDEA